MVARDRSARRTAPPIFVLPPSGASCACVDPGPTGRFEASSSGQRMTLMGRPLPTADGGCPVAQLGGQLSGGEIARPTGAGRPKAEAAHGVARGRTGPSAHLS